MRRHARNPNNRLVIRRQMDELVAAQIARDGVPQPPSERPPAEQQIRLGFEETDPPSDWDIPECYVFKVLFVLAPACVRAGFSLTHCRQHQVLGPYCGVLTAFWNDLWSSNR